MSETTESTSPAAAASSGKKRGGLNSMLIADLKAMAGAMGVPGASGMKKAQLVEAIKAAQLGSPPGGQSGPQAGSQAGKGGEPTGARPEQSPGKKAGPPPVQKAARDTSKKVAASAGSESDSAQAKREDNSPRESESRRDSGGRTGQDQGSRDQGNQEQGNQGKGGEEQGSRDSSQGKAGEGADRASEKQDDDHQGGNRGSRNRGDRNQNDGGGRGDRNQNDGGGRGDRNQSGQNQSGQNQSGQNQSGQNDEQGGRSRRRRGRDRNDRGARTNRSEPDTTILDDDVLVPAAGILDVLDNYAFVRTSGYLPGSDDCYVSLSMVRKFGLRRGDAIVGQVRQPREGERKEKFNPMVRIDSVNGADPETAKSRVDFPKLTPLYPTERLRLETEPANLIGRVIDIAAPIGKGQRGLIVSPAKAGKTMIMQSIANSITTNNPECHLMVVLVDERPEEVTDFERSVKGEVISSTFDRPASDHTTVAELAIERAKRLVELGHDVVVLLDGITRLGRAYNLAAPASGRILSGGVDSAALYPPKRFFGAARNIEDGGSLTILATALIESGSKMDEVIFEEFKGTGNMEIRLRRDFADKRIFPAIDAVQSGTRREELLMSKEELAIVWKLRRVLSGLDGQQALELLLERLKKSHSNIEFLMQVQKSTPSPNGKSED
ncbi:MAG: transcription termination factor Rho [Nocardioides sp.]|nr:transcription termination factor Rho [Nocardioides sp.]